LPDDLDLPYKRLDLRDFGTRRLTHQLFRYPAKFHPPVVAELLDRFTSPGQLVLDPFVGSGTALVESAVMRRRSVGLDIDPVATMIAKAKTAIYNIPEVVKDCSLLLEAIDDLERPDEEYELRMFEDVTEAEYDKTIANEGLWVPAIPNLHHWFRRYVIIDLARILFALRSIECSDQSKLLLRAVFASIIRNSSNADPVPVSGLEYTAHMKRRDAKGRLVNPFGLLRVALRKTEAAVSEYVKALPAAAFEPLVGIGDALALPLSLSSQVDAVLTSPPYQIAVDYYRRHQLEMYWLEHTLSQNDRLGLLPRYIGRPAIPAKNPLLQEPWSPSAIADEWETRIRQSKPGRANDFRHYVLAMTRSLREIGRVTNSGAPVLVVVGQSTWNGETIPTRFLFAEMASDFFLEETLYYPVKNRYMSYSRHNEANIDEEYVLVFRRK
jgi:hypothetical protein